MIYCIDYSDVRSHLRQIGWIEGESTDETVLFEKDGEILTFHVPNVNGHIPEAIINDAFYRAGIASPAWDVFWCD